MKKYYCATCKTFKNRSEISLADNTRIAFFRCNWCHDTKIYTTEEILTKLARKMLDDKDLNCRYGSYGG